MTKKLVMPLVAAGAIAFPATAGAVSFHGVVVAKQARRHALIVASPSGLVRTVHSHRLATTVGARVAVSAARLSDGTFSARRVTVHGRANKARIHGIVAQRRRGGFLLAAGHSVLAVRGSGPPPGTVVDVTVKTDDNDLEQEDFDEIGEVEKIELEGKILSITPATATMDGEIVLQVGKSTIDVVVPAGTALPALKAGDNVELKVRLSGQTFTLVRAEDEDNDEGDDDGGGGDDDGGGHHHGGGDG
jgi:hypothetical protein